MASEWKTLANSNYHYIEDMPAGGGVYVVFLSFKKQPIHLCYIGSSRNIQTRLRSHRLHKYARYSCIIECRFGKAHDVIIKYKFFDSEDNFKKVEVGMIKRLHPRFNVTHNA